MLARNLALLATVLGTASACGGAQTQKTAGAARDGTQTPGEQGSAAGPQLPSCDDGSCFACGDGICPTGFYCETNGDATGCASNLSCPDTPTCACLAAELAKDPRCSCADRDGAAFVTCAP